AADGRPNAVQEGGAGAQVDRLAPRRFHLADGHQLIAELFQRLHHRLEREVAAFSLRMPGVGPHAAREVGRAEPEAPPWRRGERRNHRVQERQCDRGAHCASHERTARKMLLGDDHGFSLSDRIALSNLTTLAVLAGAGTASGSNLVRIWNGALSTIPRTMA